MVAQLGLAMMPLCVRASAALISGMTSGTSSSRRKACELSTTTAPRRTASGYRAFATSSSAAPSTISTPSNASGAATSTVTSPHGVDTTLPAERGLAKSLSAPTGNCCSSRHVSICVPTAPVAPTIATTYFFILPHSSQFALGMHASGNLCLAPRTRAVQAPTRRSSRYRPRRKTPHRWF